MGIPREKEKKGGRWECFEGGNKKEKYADPLAGGLGKKNREKGEGKKEKEGGGEFRRPPWLKVFQRKEGEEEKKNGKGEEQF